MAIRVSESEIKKIRELGMARSLREVANGNATPEFAEAVRRFYPKAKYGPKTKAAAEAATGSKTAEDGTKVPESFYKSPSPVAKSSVAPAAINRRIGSKDTIRSKPNVSKRNNLAGRKQNRGIGVIDAVIERHKSLDSKFKKTNPKFKRAVGEFFTGNKKDRQAAAQRRGSVTKK